MGARTTALTALIATRRQGAWSDGILKEYVQRDRLDRRDAALASQLVYGVMQNRLLLDFYLSQVVSGPMSRLQPVMLDILRLGAYQILLLDKIPDSAAVNEAVEQTKHYVNKKAAGMTNGCLRALSRQKQGLRQPEDLATRYSHPQTLVELLQQSVGEEQIEAFLRADNEAPETVLQWNPLRGPEAELLRELDEKGVRIRILGDMRAFPIEQRQALEQAQVRTAHNDGLKLNIALNYGGRAELVRAAQKLGEQCARGETQPDAIDADAISAQLYTAGQPDVDLLIRTGGEERLSNFLLWQTWYAEIIFDSTYWPDFDRARLIHDLNIFASRDRRFGRVKRT